MLSATRLSDRAKRAAIVAVIATGVEGCISPPPDPKVIVDRLMRCVECVGGERKDVVALGDAAVPILRDNLLTGPPADHITRLKESLASLAPPPSAATVALEVNEFRAMYRVRSADALGAIRTAAAKHALCVARAPGGAGAPPLPPEVNAKIDSSLAIIGGGPCP